MKGRCGASAWKASQLRRAPGGRSGRRPACRVRRRRPIGSSRIAREWACRWRPAHQVGSAQIYRVGHPLCADLDHVVARPHFPDEFLELVELLPVGEGFFAVDVLAGAHGLKRVEHVDAVGGCDDDGVHLRIAQQVGRFAYGLRQSVSRRVRGAAGKYRTPPRRPPPRHRLARSRTTLARCVPRAPQPISPMPRFPSSAPATAPAAPRPAPATAPAAPRPAPATPIPPRKRRLEDMPSPFRNSAAGRSGTGAPRGPPDSPACW